MCQVFTPDYALMRLVLGELSAHFPRRVDWRRLPSLSNLQIDYMLAFLAYLHEHGLIEFEIHKALGGYMTPGRLKITAKGLDFLQPDGGLSALAAPVIRIAPASIVAIIDEALAARGISSGERSVIKKGLGVAGEEGIRAVVGRLVEAGIAHAPDVLRIFGLT